MNLRQKLFLGLVLLANAALWIIPSNVAQLVAMDHPTLLGRYSREHFTANVAVALASVVGLYIDQARSREVYKRRWFRVAGAALALLPALLAGDLICRAIFLDGYIEDSVAYHRRAKAAWTVPVVDRPLAGYTLPNAHDGYPAFSCTLHTDERGYRNPPGMNAADIVVLGDSFAEGSHVSDDQAWPALLAKQTGRTVYNLGMSGYSPIQYLAALRQTGLGLHPHVVFCLIYEGNDFRSKKTDLREVNPSIGRKIQTFVRRSPLRAALDAGLLRLFESHGPARGIAHEAYIDWLPLHIPDNASGKSYAFAPKQIEQATEDSAEFAADKVWLGAEEILRDMADDCAKAHAALVVAVAPTKAHVTLPLVLDHVPADALRGFAMLDSDYKLPEAAKLKAALPTWLEAREAVVRDWCQKHGVGYVDLTEPLRKAVAAGRQTYFTYDQHWSPEGHAVVAETIRSVVQGSPKP